jgi:hypothetical protein
MGSLHRYVRDSMPLIRRLSAFLSRRFSGIRLVFQFEWHPGTLNQHLMLDTALVPVTD